MIKKKPRTEQTKVKRKTGFLFVRFDLNSRRISLIQKKIKDGIFGDQMRESEQTKRTSLKAKINKLGLRIKLEREF